MENLCGLSPGRREGIMSTHRPRAEALGKNSHSRICTIIIFCLLLVTPKADAAYVTIENIGTSPLLGMFFSFDIEPFPVAGSELDFQIFSHRARVDPTNKYFPFVFDESNPLPVGAQFDTFLIPELTGVNFRFIGGSLSTFNAAFTATIAPVDVVPDVTVIDFVSSSPAVPVAVRLTFKSGGTPVPAQTCVQPPSGLVSWWPGDGDADDIQNVNNGTLQGGATFALGMVGQAFNFNGLDAFVEAPENGSLDFNGPLTIDLWVKPDAASPEKSPLVSKYDFSGGMWGNVAYELSLIGPDQVIQFGITCGTTNMFRQTVPGALPLNVFSHVAAVYRQNPSPALEIYVNGQLQPGTNLGGICSFINQHDIPFRIGKRIDLGFGPVFFDGLIDEVEVFNRALSASEIQAIYNAGSAGKCKAPITVAVDIKPGDDPNVINPNSMGVIPVAILTTETFDAQTVDPMTLKFGPDGAGIVHPPGHIEDVDGDGDLDLLVHFRTQETGIACGDTEASLTGATFDGTLIEGSDAIVVKPGNGVLIDFEDPLPIVSDNDPDFTEHPAVISVNGFIVAHTVPTLPSEAGLRSAKPAAPFYSGSTALFARANGPITLMRESGDPFDLTSIDIFELPNPDQNREPIDPGDFAITFTGNLSDGGTVSQTFVKDDFLTLQTFRFSGFKDLLSVTWRQGPEEGGPGGLTHQFDNIRACVAK